jgi:hypothetical protein
MEIISVHSAGLQAAVIAAGVMSSAFRSSGEHSAGGLTTQWHFAGEDSKECPAV